MQKSDFVNECISSGLTEGQANMCYKFYSVSRDVEWSFNRAKQGFSNEQFAQVTLGFTKGLSTSEVDIYLDKQFRAEQMDEARFALLSGISPQRVKMFYKKEYSWQQMSVARRFISSIKKEYFDLVYKPEFSTECMEVIFDALVDTDVPLDILKYIYQPQFTKDQMYVAVNFKGVNMASLQIFYKPEFSTDQMRVIIDAINQEIQKEIILMFAKDCFSAEQMQEICSAGGFGITADKISVMCNPAYTSEQLSVIRGCLQAGFDLELIKAFFTPDFDEAQMSVIRDAIDAELGKEAISIIARSNYSWNQMSQALTGFREGLTSSQVNKFYQPNYTVNQMSQARQALVHKVDEANVEFLLSADLGSWDIEKARKAFEDGETLEGVLETLNIKVDNNERELNSLSSEDKLLKSFFAGISA